MAKARDFTLLLIRSCATEWDDCGRLVGSSDLPLCESGRGRLEQALDAMGPIDLDLVFSSPDESSVQIAELVAGSTNARVRVVESLADIHLGLWEGLQADQLAERYPTAFRQWQADPGSVQVPGGESFHGARERIVDGLVRAMEKSRARNTRIGVVVRPMAWAVLRCWLGSMPSSQVWEALRDAPLLAWHEADLGQLLSAAGSTDSES
ncbi:MAG: phosphoglycerate mutase family protein [Phycisphaerales bacterium]|nr:phosphoglycerate mutase family protein [Phycisphaerales bacterium]